MAQEQLSRKERHSIAVREYQKRNPDVLKKAGLKWRQQNKEYIREKQKEYKRKRKLEAIKYLGGCCSKCGGKFHPAVYEFHHINPEEKDRDPSKMLQLSWERLSSELNKCLLLCANCHRLIHHESSYGTASV